MSIKEVKGFGEVDNITNKDDTYADDTYAKRKAFRAYLRDNKIPHLADYINSVNFIENFDGNVSAFFDEATQNDVFSAKLPNGTQAYMLNSAPLRDRQDLNTILFSKKVLSYYDNPTLRQHFDNIKKRVDNGFDFLSKEEFRALSAVMLLTLPNCKMEMSKSALTAYRNCHYEFFILLATAGIYVPLQGTKYKITKDFCTATNSCQIDKDLTIKSMNKVLRKQKNKVPKGLIDKNTSSWYSVLNRFTDNYARRVSLPYFTKHFKENPNTLYAPTPLSANVEKTIRYMTKYAENTAKRTSTLARNPYLSIKATINPEEDNKQLLTYLRSRNNAFNFLDKETYKNSALINHSLVMYADRGYATILYHMGHDDQVTYNMQTGEYIFKDDSASRRKSYIREYFGLSERVFYIYYTYLKGIFKLYKQLSQDLQTGSYPYVNINCNHNGKYNDVDSWFVENSTEVNHTASYRHTKDGDTRMLSYMKYSHFPYYNNEEYSNNYDCDLSCMEYMINLFL